VTQENLRIVHYRDRAQYKSPEQMVPCKADLKDTISDDGDMKLFSIIYCL